VDAHSGLILIRGVLPWLVGGLFSGDSSIHRRILSVDRW
jgi:hypothetical protein